MGLSGSPIGAQDRTIIGAAGVEPGDSGEAAAKRPDTAVHLGHIHHGAVKALQSTVVAGVGESAHLEGTGIHHPPVPVLAEAGVAAWADRGDWQVEGMSHHELLAPSGPVAGFQAPAPSCQLAVAVTFWPRAQME